MHPIEEQVQRTRRQFLTTAAGGIGGLALTALLGSDGYGAVNPLAAKANHTTPKAKAWPLSIPGCSCAIAAMHGKRCSQAISRQPE